MHPTPIRAGFPAVMSHRYVKYRAFFGLKDLLFSAGLFFCLASGKKQGEPDIQQMRQTAHNQIHFRKLG
jgi:hypothetical protein